MENAAKRQRANDAADEAVRSGWRFIDTKQECFLLDEIAPNEAFLSLNVCGQGLQPVELFLKVITDSIMDRLHAEFLDDNLILGVRKKSKTTMVYLVTGLRIC